eukprot:15420925-Alexandrium_andersonii.AAC.1
MAAGTAEAPLRRGAATAATGSTDSAVKVRRSHGCWPAPWPTDPCAPEPVGAAGSGERGRVRP